MAIDNNTMDVIKAVVAQELQKATSLKDAAQGIAKGVTQYVGARYVPLFANPAQWSGEREYEPLTIVLYQGNSFTSMQYVPIGIDINNEEFWAQTGNYNAQVEQYRQEVRECTKKIAALENTQTQQGATIETLKATTENLGNSVNALNAKVETQGETINVLDGRVDALDTAVDGIKASDKRNLIADRISNADGKFRAHIASDEEWQGGCPVGDKYYAVFLKSPTKSRVDLFNVETGKTATSIDLGDPSFKGNNMSYCNGELICSGSSKTSKGNLIYFLKVDGGNLSLARTIDSSQFGMNEACWGFGHYKDDDEHYYWATEYLTQFYYVNKSCTKKTLIGSVELPNNTSYSNSMQQAMSYNKEYDVFISSRSNCFNLYDGELHYIKTVPIADTLNCIWREEIEQVTLYDGKLWMHNNPVIRSYSTFASPAVWSVELQGQVSQGYPTGGWNEAVAIVFDNETEIPIVEDGNPTATVTVGNTVDVGAAMTELGNSTPLFRISMQASTPYIIFLPKYAEVNLNEQTVGGIEARGGATIYGASTAYRNLANAKQAALFRAVGAPLTLYTEITSDITSGGKRMVDMYGGVLCLRNQNSLNNLKGIQPDASDRSFGVVVIE
jgi:hypothetical protein